MTKPPILFDFTRGVAYRMTNEEASARRKARNRRIRMTVGGVPSWYVERVLGRRPSADSAPGEPTSGSNPASGAE